MLQPQYQELIVKLRREQRRTELKIVAFIALIILAIILL